MVGYLVVGGTAAVVTFLATYVMRWIAPRIGAMAQPGARSVHEYPTPTLGGAAMFLGLLAAMLVGSRIPQFDAMFTGSSEPLGILLAAGVMFLVGVVDDSREVSAPAKVAGQVLSGSVLSMFGVTMLYFRVPFASFEYIVLSPDLASLLTVVGVVILANAMNLIDGLDGLAAGIAAIAGLALFLYADRLFKAGLLEGTNVGPLVAIIVVGVAVGFLPHNFNPARIFMGDAGAMLLGLLLAVTTITIGGRTADQFSGQTYFFFAPLVIPIVILGVPIADTAFSFFRRLLRRQSVSQADREHLHHRLMRLGHGPRRSVVILWLWTAVLSAAALVPTYTNRGNSLVPIALAALALLLYSYFHPGVVRLRRRDRAARDDRSGADPVDPVGPRAPDEPPGPAATIVDLEARRRAAGGR